MFSSDKRQPPPGCLGDSPDRRSEVSSDALGLTAKVMDPLPLAAGTQTKTQGAPDQLSGTAEAALKIGKEGRISGTISWEIIRELPALELRVTAPSLKTWLPSAKRFTSGSYGPGTPIEFTAEVVDPTGRSTGNLRIRRMRWWLEDKSRLPGVSMNWLGGEDSTPDLKIAGVGRNDDAQWIEFTNLPTLRKSIKVEPWDHGAWGTLRVEAELDDGRTLQGKIVGQTGGDPTAIRLPARDPDSKIASIWKDMWAKGKADDADDDDIGAGTSKGDGFTVYEEYRGFYVNGKYERGIPVVKEVFVYDRIHDTDTNLAIEYFRAASETLTYVIKPGMGELDDSRLVNRNRGNGPTRGDQHAIGLLQSDGAIVPSFVGNRPGDGEVMIPPRASYSRVAPKLATRSELYPRAIAQAMLRACGVPRPGYGDRTIYASVTRGPDGGPVVTAHGLGRVTVRDEISGHDLGEDWLAEVDKEAALVRARMGDRSESSAEGAAQGAAEAVAKRPPFHLAKRGGQHSGPLGNIMRDAFADAYLIEETSTIIMLSPSIPEIIGDVLSPTSAGDGYNASGGTLRVRYGDSKRPPSYPSFKVKENGS